MTPKEAIDNIMWTPLMRSPNEHGELKEALYMACNALEKADIYRWHDLRKEPNKLPEYDGEYLIAFEFGNEIKYAVREYILKENAWGCAVIPIAWARIEPFE